MKLILTATAFLILSLTYHTERTPVSPILVSEWSVEQEKAFKKSIKSECEQVYKCSVEPEIVCERLKELAIKDPDTWAHRFKRSC